MYNLSKYKAYFKVKFFLSKFSSKRFLKFKATKWKILQEYIKKNHTDFSLSKGNIPVYKSRKVKIQKKFKNFCLVTPKKRIIKLSRYFNEGVQLKRSLKLYFNNALSKNDFKITKKQNFQVFKDLLTLVLLKPLFKLDILLWQLGLFKSIRQIHQLIHNNKIWINQNPGKINQLLEKGDIIFFKNISLKKRDYIKKHFYSILELDFYSNKLIIINSYKNLGNEAYFLLLPKVSFDLLKFLTYIKQ